MTTTESNPIAKLLEPKIIYSEIENLRVELMSANQGRDVHKVANILQKLVAAAHAISNIEQRRKQEITSTVLHVMSSLSHFHAGTMSEIDDAIRDGEISAPEAFQIAKTIDDYTKALASLKKLVLENVEVSE